MIKESRASAVVVVDMINDFVHGRPPSLPPTPKKDPLILKCHQALKWARRQSIPIIFTNDGFDPHEMPTSPEYRLWGAHAIVGTHGAQVVDELRPLPNDFVLTKKRYSAFLGTNLDLLLRELAIDHIVAFGIQTECCVQHTVWDAFARSYATTILSDACDTLDASEHERALRYMQRYYSTQVLSVDGWITSMAQKYSHLSS